MYDPQNPVFVQLLCGSTDHDVHILALVACAHDEVGGQLRAHVDTLGDHRNGREIKAGGNSEGSECTIGLTACIGFMIVMILDKVLRLTILKRGCSMMCSLVKNAVTFVKGIGSFRE